LLEYKQKVFFLPFHLFRQFGNNPPMSPTPIASESNLIDLTSKDSYLLEELLNKVVQGDAREVLKKMPEASVDLVFFDPPYYLQLPKKHLTRWQVHTDVNGVNDSWDQFSSFQEYEQFILEILSEIRRLMKPSATIWAIATYHNLFRMGKIMQDLGYWILNDVVWVKPNPMPNWLKVRFTNATETLIWAVRDRASRKYTFHKEHAKDFGIGSIGANVWIVPTCIGKERLKDESGQKIHSTQKPIELLRRVILSASNEGEVILDPMAGVGTTAVVAQALNRSFILIEQNSIYVQAALHRLNQKTDLQNKVVYSINRSSYNSKKSKER
jgi:DNA modification methylase